MNQQIVDIMYVSDMLVIKSLSGTIWPIFSSVLIFYYYLARLKSREVSRKNMRNSENVGNIVIRGVPLNTSLQGKKYHLY